MDRKKVFVSYSWDDKEHQDWVLQLASDLMEDFGVEVIIDQYELSAGRDLTYFMETSIERAEKVLVILTPNYKEKAENRKSGVGYESSIISQSLFVSPITNVKFIPILRSGTKESSSPIFLSSKLYHEMKDDTKYSFQIHALAKIIYGEPLRRKPALGPIPDFNQKVFDPFIDKANSLKAEEELNNELNSIIYSHEGIEIIKKQFDKLQSIIKEKVTLYQANTNFSFATVMDNNYSLIYTSGYAVRFYHNTSYNNDAKKIKLVVSYWTGRPSENSYHRFHFPGEEPKKNNEVEYSFDLNYQKAPVWKHNTESSDIEKITSEAFIYLIEKISEEKNRGFRKH